MTFGWDTAHGWRTSRTDASSVTGYGYDGPGHLTSITGPGAAAASFTYDAAGQRMTSAVTASDGATGTVTTNTAYTYEGLNLLSLAATTSVGTTYSVSYAFDGAGHPYAGVYRASETTHPLLFGITTTDHGDVAALTDGRGIAFASYTYDAWGNPTSQLATSTADASGTPVVTVQLATTVAARQVLRYASYCWDAQAGLYYCSARYYDPSTMQFITKDPAKADGEESAYQYCGGDPVGNVDPSGLKIDGGGYSGFYGPRWITRCNATVVSAVVDRLVGIPATIGLKFRNQLAAGLTGVAQGWQSSGSGYYAAVSGFTSLMTSLYGGDVARWATDIKTWWSVKVRFQHSYAQTHYDWRGRKGNTQKWTAATSTQWYHVWTDASIGELTTGGGARSTVAKMKTAALYAHRHSWDEH